MEDYEIIKRLGGGSFADVFLAKEKSTSDMVAIKVLKKKYRKFDECCELRECKSLQKLCKDSLASQKGYDNIIKLKQIIFEKKTGKLSLVFEYMETDLYELMKKRSPGKLSEEEIKDITYQTLLGLYHMHKYGFFHRDMKPENLLLTGKKVKIADFGLAREIRSVPPYTEYVSTRYYRAPECILRTTNYNSPIDIWALGCIMAEMYMHPMPLFYGATEKEVFVKICTTLGSPTPSTWIEGINQANLIGMKYPQSSGTDLATIVTGASPEAIDLMKQMLKWDPNCRATATQLLNHPFFNGCGYDMKKVTNSNFFSEFGDVKAFNKTNRRFRPNNESNEKKDNDDNMFSKVLNDTKGFNDLLNQLKKEEIEENKNYEKNKHKNNFGILEDTFYKKHLNNNMGENNYKKVINEEKENENDSDSEDKFSSNKKKNKNNNTNKKDLYDDFNFDFNDDKNKDNNKEINNKKESEFDYLFNSDKKNRNVEFRDNFRKDTSSKKKKDDYDYLFNRKDNNVKEDKFDNLLKKKNDDDFSNIDSEINKILGKDNNGFNFNNNNNNIYSSNRYKSQKLNNPYNNNDLFSLPKEKQYDKNNLKPIINGGRRGGGGGGLMAIGYEPNKNSLFNDFDFGGLGINRKQDNINNKYGYKKDTQPVVIKEKKNNNIFGFNNREDQPGYKNNMNNNFGKNDKFSAYERNNPLMNQFNNEMNGVSRRKRNFYSSPNYLGWGI
jgi:serine/threonine protein kinase